MGLTRQPQRVGAIFDGLIDSKATVYHGVRMRSRLEADFARHLDRMGVAWTYEPAIYGPRGKGYLPDFELARPGRRCFLELKPTLAEAPLARQRMEVIWEAHPDALLLVACAEGCTWFGALSDGKWTEWTERWAQSARASSSGDEQETATDG